MMFSFQANVTKILGMRNYLALRNLIGKAGGQLLCPENVKLKEMVKKMVVDKGYTLIQLPLWIIHVGRVFGLRSHII